ncbi:Hexose transporter 2 [Fusarium albosuccineum]|uniref:Hexose transporter 2 n=1 Tax=Fusarium albosuccineum TaxID=1237068 RepID=A0A8H4PEV4_9HYPO|nr:Hexose transporter 2 [Fusarium albosuccineum]
MMGEAVPYIITLCILPLVDESPRWLFFKGRDDEAIEILARLHANGERENPLVVAETQEIRGALEHEKKNNGGWKDLVSPGKSQASVLTFALSDQANSSQLEAIHHCGFYEYLLPDPRRQYDSVSPCHLLGCKIKADARSCRYFSSTIVANLGIESSRTVITVNIGLLLWKAFCAVGGVFLIDRIGVRKPLIIGTGVTVVLFGLLSGLSYLSDVYPNNNGYAIGAIVVVALFLLTVSNSWSILAYTYPPEVLSYSQRAKGVVVAQAIGYAFSFLNLYTTPLAIERIGWKYYALNGGWNIGILAVIIWLFVETKGRTLEEIDEIFEGVVFTDGVIIGRKPVENLEPEDLGDAGSLTKRTLTATSTNKD